MSLAPVPSENATCANCSAPLVADQRYCLSCGQPCSPVRLAFLDVLQGEGKPQVSQHPLASTPAMTYAPLLEPAQSGWLRRYSPIFGALTVLLLAMIAGLLVGHWVTQGKSVAAAPTQQTIKIEGLGGLGAVAANTAPSAATTTPAPSASSQPSAKEEAEEVADEAKAEKAQSQKIEKTKPRKASTNTLQKLNSTTGKKHAEELNKLGAEPIETG